MEDSFSSYLFISRSYARTCLHFDSCPWSGRSTRDLKVAGSTPLGKLFTCMCLGHKAVYFGTGKIGVIPYTAGKIKQRHRSKIAIIGGNIAHAVGATSSEDCLVHVRSH